MSDPLCSQFEFSLNHLLYKDFPNANIATLSAPLSNSNSLHAINECVNFTVFSSKKQA